MPDTVNMLEKFLINFSKFAYMEWIVALLIFVSLLFVRSLILHLLFKKVNVFAQKYKLKEEYIKSILSALKNPLSWFLLLLAVFISISYLSLSKNKLAIVECVFRGGSILTLAWALSGLSDTFAIYLKNKLKEKGESNLSGFVPLLKTCLRYLILIVGVLMVLDNLGFSVSGILTTLGLGGAALAFASKDTIANFFGSLSIVLDQPFKTGDWIQVGDVLDGTVESIGLRSTRIRTFPKTLVSVPNSVLANDRINNWSRMPKRRVRQFINLTYDSTAEQMDSIVEDIRKLLRADEGVNQEFILVNFTDFSSSSLDVMVYYFTSTIDWVEHMNVRQRINCKIMKAVQARGLSFAFPTQTIHLSKEGTEYLTQNIKKTSDAQNDYPR